MTTSPNSASQTVAEEIAVLMARRGRMTNAALAAATGIEKSTLGRKLKGAPFKVDELEAIAAFFDVPITDLFGRPSGSGEATTHRSAPRTRSVTNRPDTGVLVGAAA